MGAETGATGGLGRNTTAAREKNTVLTLVQVHVKFRAITTVDPRKSEQNGKMKKRRGMSVELTTAHAHSNLVC